MMEERNYKHIGKPYNRKDAQEKVTGQAIYAHDLELPGMLHAILHSPICKSNDSIHRYQRAESLPG